MQTISITDDTASINGVALHAPGTTLPPFGSVGSTILTVPPNPEPIWKFDVA